MASSSTLLSQINEDFLTCRVCMDTFKQPKVLNCQHSFCMTCLESCSKTENGSYMLCPVCRQLTLLGIKGVQGLKDNFVFSNMIEMLDTWKKSRLVNSPARSVDTMDAESDIMCATCPSNEATMATFQCLDCLDQLCADCAAFHSRTKLTKGHEVVSLHEIESGVHQKRIRARELSKCSIHENIQMQHYCKDCDTPVCRDCIVDAHQGHNLVCLEEAEITHKEEVVKMKLQLEKDVLAMEDSLKEIMSEKEKEEENATNNKNRIKAQCNEIIKTIKERETILLEELEKLSAENISRIKSCKDGTETQLNCTENCIQFSNYVLEDVESIEIITMHRQIKETVKQLQCKANEVTTRNKKILESCLKVEINCGDPKEAAKQMGEIKTECTAQKVEKGNEELDDMDDEDWEKNPFLCDLKKPPKLPPKPTPRSMIENSKQASLPKPVKRSAKPCKPKKSSTPDPGRRSSVLVIQTGDKSLQGSSGMSKSLANLSEKQNESKGQYEIRRQAPKPPSPNKPCGKDQKHVDSPKKGKAPLPPPKLPTKRSSPAISPKPHKPTNIKRPEPLIASQTAKFGRKGKVLTNGEFAGPPRCVIFSGIKKKILVLDSDNKHILVFTVDGFFKKSFKVALPDQVNCKPIAIAEAGSKHILVLFKNFVTKWSWNGTMEHLWGTSELVDANSVATDSKGRILVSDQERHMVFVYDPHSRQKLMQLGGFGDRDDLFKSPRYLCVDQQDRIIISDHHNHAIKVFNREGKFMFKFGERGSADGQLRYPEALACMRLENGEDGVLIADEGNCRLSLFTSQGKFLCHVLTKQEDNELTSPQYLSVSLDGKGEEIVIRETNQMKIRVYRVHKLTDR